MNIIKIAIISLFIPWQVNSAGIPVPLGNIDIKLEVTTLPRIEVEKPQGGWYTNINLNNSPDNTAIYQSEVPVIITLRQHTGFRISVKNPLILTRQTNNSGVPEITFSPAQVYWGENRTNLRQLSAIPEIFTVGKRATNLTSTDYILHISALAPSGRGSAGKYHGQLTLIFETNS
ncbi:fimbrial protein [Yersinia rohdei]|uniref:fimbrial protein n=1 Tax=Yersinia rohdei TaxID=29485 RepID=UPI0011A72ED0|nr:fimbrial protein [Yersinia rohdei]